jgi:hypothetical protein
MLKRKRKNMTTTGVKDLSIWMKPTSAGSRQQAAGSRQQAGCGGGERGGRKREGGWA